MVMTDKGLESAHSGPDPIDVEVGINLRQARRAKGMSQSELADALGMSFQAVQKYERGDSRVSASVLVKAAKALGVSPTALLPPETPLDQPPSLLIRLAAVRGADELVEAYARIPSTPLRRIVLDLALALGESQKAPIAGGFTAAEGSGTSPSR